MRQAFIDESVIEPNMADGVYVIAAAVVIDDADEVRSLVVANLNRKRPFHWMDDQGPIVRERLLRLIVETKIHSVVAYENLVGPRTQEPARRRLLHDEVLPRLHRREVGHIVFEQRGGQDQHDKRTMAEFRADAAIAVRWS